MTSPLKYILRRFALKKNMSMAEHGIVPLADLHSAVVFIDRTAPEADAAEAAAKEFFGGRGIALTVLSPGQEQLNHAGYMRRAFRLPGGKPRGEDLFISLSCRDDDFASEFEARCSPARFKIGCFPLEGGIYDMTVTPPDGARLDQLALFGAITEYLLKIK